MFATPSYATDDDKWSAILGRDRTADAYFRYSVATTGVYCRPSCPSRRPRRENVRFHADGKAAEACGFRPCRRCHPDRERSADPHLDVVIAACRRIAEADEPPHLAELAGAAGFSPHHFHRLFKAATGVTPKAYGAACRAGRVRRDLTLAPTITEALYDAGFNSSGRFYAAADFMLGMTPSAWRAGGAGEIIRTALGTSSLGRVLVAVTDKGVCAILIGDDPALLTADLRRRFPKADLVDGDGGLGRLVADVIALIDDPAGAHVLPLDIRGTAFQQRVWTALRAIPPGTTLSYGELAAALGLPRGARAVAGACAANPLAVAIPCHRLVRGDGDTAGYRWGAERKRTLIEREKRSRKT